MVTGSIAVDPETDFNTSLKRGPPLGTWFAFTPLACATCSTLAPGSKVSSTIRRFSTKAWRLRGRRSPTNPSERIMPDSHPTLDYMPEGITTRLPCILGWSDPFAFCKLLINMVGTTGFEPATSSVSRDDRQCFQ